MAIDEESGTLWSHFALACHRGVLSSSRRHVNTVECVVMPTTCHRYQTPSAYVSWGSGFLDVFGHARCELPPLAHIVYSVGRTHVPVVPELDRFLLAFVSVESLPPNGYSVRYHEQKPSTPELGHVDRLSDIGGRLSMCDRFC